MKHGRLLWTACCLLLAAGCATARTTTKDPRVVVIPISGNEAASGTVADVVDSRYELISSRRYAKAARELDAKSQKSRDIRKVSRKLEIDALVHGEFVKRGKRKYELRLSLRAGSSGEEFESLTIKLRSKKLSTRDRRKIKKRLYAALSEVDVWEEEKLKERERKLRGEEEKRERRERKAEEKRVAREEKRREREDREEQAERKKGKKKERTRDDDDEEDEDKDEDDSRREHKSKKTKKKKKKKKKEETYEVRTERDETGQALDEESPF